jgi:endonuclease/exonuclease/phosphatase (EEP) superfamily protein YafD
VGIELWLFLDFILRDTWWPLALANNAAVFLFLPLVPLALLAWFAPRRRVLLGLLVFPALTFAWLYGGLFLPRLEAAPAGTPLRAMTYNVLYSNRDYAAIAEVVHTVNADVVGFEELSSEHVAALITRLADYPYQALNLGDGLGDVGLVSRFPIESAEAFDLPPRNLAMRVVLNVDGRRVRVYVVHLSADNFGPLQAAAMAPGRFAARAGETNQLRAELETLTDPYLLLCDCNLTDQSAAHRTLRAVLGDSFREAGWGFGHTITVLGFPVPLQRIDYVWHSPAFYATAAQVAGRGGSDHHATWADLTLKTP